MQSPTKKLKEIDRLLSAYPPTNAKDPAQEIRNYVNAVEDFHADDVEEGVTLFLKGKMPGHDGRFAPTAPMLATACRKAAELRARAAYLDGLSRPKLPPPDIQHTPEERERIKALVAETVANLTAVTESVNGQSEADRKRWRDRMDARFAPDQSEEAIRARLVDRDEHWWDVGSDEDAA